MRTSCMALLCGVAFLTACASSSEKPTEEDGSLTATVEASKDEQSKTLRRLQIERSVDNWWAEYTQQRYSTADGLAAVLERYVNEHFDEVAQDVKTASPRFRRVAAAALGFSGKKEAVPHLVDALGDPLPEVRLSSLLSLWMLAKEGVEIPTGPVQGYLSDPDPDIRSNAAMVLAHAAKPGDGQLFLPLTTAMKDARASVRVHAAAALGALGDPDSVPFLLEDPSPDVSKAAHKALQVITGQDLPRQKSEWDAYFKEHLAN